MSPSIERSGDRLADSAKKLERSTARVEDSADRRTELAANRTVFAAERTYAAWVRTGLLALASGIGAKALFTESIPEWFGTVTGTVLVLFADDRDERLPRLGGLRHAHRAVGRSRGGIGIVNNGPGSSLRGRDLWRDGNLRISYGFEAARTSDWR